MIDMDDLVGDSDFFQPMEIWRRQKSYDADGKPVDTPSNVTPSPLGSIQSGANPELLRQANLATTANLITIYTGFRLRCEGDTIGMAANPQGTVPTDDYGNAITTDGAIEFRADVVMYGGVPYEVFLVNDWTAYGAGFIGALARQITASQAGLT